MLDILRIFQMSERIIRINLLKLRDHIGAGLFDGRYVFVLDNISSKIRNFSSHYNTLFYNSKGIGIKIKLFVAT